MPWRCRSASAIGLALSLAAACTRRGAPLDLVRAAPAMAEMSVAGRSREWILGQSGKQVRINDEVRVTLPASPPSRLRYTVDLPPRARLALACGIPPERHDRPGVEFVVKVKRGDREETAFTLLLDPVSRRIHRRWVPEEIDLSRWAGERVDVVLETRGFEEGDDPRRAFWGSPAITSAAAEAPLAIVYLVDTLRADHTTPYGYARNTTPELARFAADAALFEQAVAQASWTKPSVASVLTSLLPGRHRAVQLRDRLDPGVVTIAEMLGQKGIATGAAIANSVIYAQGVEFEQGFDLFAGLHGAGDRPSKVVEAAGVVDAALQWLDARAGLPTFLYVHTMDPHVPYTPPPPFDQLYEPHPNEAHPAADPRLDYHEPLDRDRLIAQYDGEIAYGDREFGRFVAELKRRGLYDRALIVFMADHGEEFEDHGQWLHGRSVFDELVRIPLLVKFPGRRHAGRRIAQQVQEVDVLPTVLETLGLPVPAPPAIDGRPLQSTIERREGERPAVSEISHRGYVAHGMRTRADKYIRRFSPEDDELYFDLLHDPRERTNRLAEAGERVRLLKAGVEAAMIPNAFRYRLRLPAGGEWRLELATGGWFEGVEATAFGPADRYEVRGNGRKLVVDARGAAAAARELAFGIRPMGAPVSLQGSRKGRPLRAEEVFIAEEGMHPAGMPARLPDLESELGRTENLLAPPPAASPGVQIWLALAPGSTPMSIDREACERLRALGYVAGECHGR
jgi:arylsulfatase A-like enzyme